MNLSSLITQSHLEIFFLAYLIGSIPFGYLLTKAAGLGDIRSIGSGNIGATNVLRTGRKGLAALTLFLDCIKGTIAVLLAERLFHDNGRTAALAVMIGHLFPVWLKLRGGKGVATCVGIFLGLNWVIGVTMIVVWMLSAKISKYSSLAALISIGLLPLYCFLFHQNDLILFSLFIAGMVYLKHYANIRRLLNGTEGKIGGAT